MRVLVTGGAGFIGGHVAERFAADGHDVTVIDSFEPFYDVGLKERSVAAARAAAERGPGSYALVRGDVRDVDLVRSHAEDADVVYHQAAQAGVRTSVEQPVRVNDVNVAGTLAVLEAARAADVSRVVNASSSSVYGPPEYLPYDEAHPTRPVSPYGASKLAAEHYARLYGELYGLPTVSLRYFTVYGPRMRPNMAISNFVSRCFRDEPPVVYGDGTQTRDFTYVEDVLEANAAVLDTAAADGEVLNVGSAGAIDIRTLAAAVRDELAPGLELAFADRHDADAEHTHADVSKAGELLDYDPSTDIRTGVRRFIDWYEANRDWYEPLVLGS